MATGLLAASTAFANEEIKGGVTTVDISYFPGMVAFKLDTGTATCPAGGWLRWQNTSVDNNKSAYALLLEALATGKQVDFYYASGDTNCMGINLALLNN
jgi:hypothetical protein